MVCITQYVVDVLTTVGVMKRVLLVYQTQAGYTVGEYQQNRTMMASYEPVPKLHRKLSPDENVRAHEVCDPTMTSAVDLLHKLLEQGVYKTSHEKLPEEIYADACLNQIFKYNSRRGNVIKNKIYSTSKLGKIGFTCTPKILARLVAEGRAIAKGKYPCIKNVALTHTSGRTRHRPVILFDRPLSVKDITYNYALKLARRPATSQQRHVIIINVGGRPAIAESQDGRLYHINKGNTVAINNIAPLFIPIDVSRIDGSLVIGGGRSTPHRQIARILSGSKQYRHVLARFFDILRTIEPVAGPTVQIRLTGLSHAAHWLMSIVLGSILVACERFSSADLKRLAATKMIQATLLDSVSLSESNDPFHRTTRSHASMVREVVAATDALITGLPSSTQSTAQRVSNLRTSAQKAWSNLGRVPETPSTQWIIDKIKASIGRQIEAILSTNQGGALGENADSEYPQVEDEPSSSGYTSHESWYTITRKTNKKGRYEEAKQVRPDRVQQKATRDARLRTYSERKKHLHQYLEERHDKNNLYTVLATLHDKSETYDWVESNSSMSDSDSREKTKEI